MNVPQIRSIGDILNWLKNHSKENIEKIRQYWMSFETADEILSPFKNAKQQLSD